VVTFFIASKTLHIRISKNKIVHFYNFENTELFTQASSGVVWRDCKKIIIEW